MFAHNPHHSNPHAKTPSKFLADEDSQDASREGTKVVDANDDAFEAAAGVAECGTPIFVAYNAGEDSLVVTEQD